MVLGLNYFIVTYTKSCNRRYSRDLAYFLCSTLLYGKLILAKNHYSPVFANKRWTDASFGNKYKRFYYCEERKKVVEAPRDIGKSGWGYENDLYSVELEQRLDSELETLAEPLYEKLVNDEVLSTEERMRWGQFIVTQASRTPSFFKYRDYIEAEVSGSYRYKDTIIGCIGCAENKYIACRNWVILQAHEDDFFVRTDNPVYMNGFIEMPNTTIFYPLSPKKCFVACSTPEYFPTLKGERPIYPKQDILQLEKGDTYTINFELIKSANREAIMAIPNYNSAISTMHIKMLGAYPQIPYLMSRANNPIQALEETAKLVEIMSIVDNYEYPIREYTFEYFFGVEFSEGINPFSIFGVTDNNLPSIKG